MTTAKRVLVVEDSRLQAQLATKILCKHGYLSDIALTPKRPSTSFPAQQCQILC